MSEPVSALCPACPEASELILWRSDRAGATVHYCRDCCGAWVKREVIDILGMNAKADLLPLWIGPPAISDRPVRPCPACGAPMERKSCGQVAVDVCSPHGIWFDCQELEQFVRWLRDRADAHLRAVGAPVALDAGGIPPGDRDWHALANSGGQWGAALAIELILGIFDAWP